MSIGGARSITLIFFFNFYFEPYFGVYSCFWDAKLKFQENKLGPNHTVTLHTEGVGTKPRHQMSHGEGRSLN